MIELRGLTWDHPRGLAPLRATAAAYAEAHPDVHVAWDVRSLQAFGDQPLEDLARRFDLLVIDHPFAGAVARGRWLLPLDEHLEEDFLAEQAAQSVGLSHDSYRYKGHQWALAIDAAAQVSAFRPDLLEQRGLAVPRTWDEVLALARRSGPPSVALPATPVNIVNSFFSLCAIHGESPGRDGARLIGRETGRMALAILGALLRSAHPASLELDPPGTLELMSLSDEIAYCPLLFGYCNYGRPGYAPHLCRFTNIPVPQRGAQPIGGTLGGTGLAISSQCSTPAVACDYAQWVAGAECQRTLYVESGGQPGNVVAWKDAEANAATTNFFLDTLVTVESAYLRPRYDGFVAFQDKAGILLHTHVRTGGDDSELLDRLDALYRASRGEGGAESPTL
jgi:multiple sugar transport system substrate-binding protein